MPELRGIPVVVVSAKADVRDKVDLLLGGAADYLTKPFDTDELLARVTARLREHTASPLVDIYICGDLKLCLSSDGTVIFENSVGELVPAEYFGVVERFSVFAATGFNAALGIHLFLERQKGADELRRYC
ncbi:MAG: response regulator transcription factor [Eubacteriales bacterium]